MSSVARLAAKATPGRRVYVPKNDRRPVLTDTPWVILKRQKAARRIRSILYGLPDNTICPCWGDKDKGGFYKRESTWAWMVREFVHLKDFRYSRLLTEARKFVEEHGRLEFPVDEPPEVALQIDLDLLKAFENRLKRFRTEEETWRNRSTNQDEGRVLAEMAEAEAKTLLLAGVCPSCGDDLPCKECGVPRYEIDGRGGIQPCPAR